MIELSEGSKINVVFIATVVLRRGEPHLQINFKEV